MKRFNYSEKCLYHKMKAENNEHISDWDPAFISITKLIIKKKLAYNQPI